MPYNFQLVLTLLKVPDKDAISTNTKVEKGSDQNTIVLCEHVSSNDKNTMSELYIKQDKNSLHWSATKVLKKRQMSLLHRTLQNNAAILFSRNSSK